MAQPRALHRHGILDDAPLEVLVDITRALFSSEIERRYIRKHGLKLVLDYLLEHSGDTWQQRWEASALHTEAASLANLFDRRHQRDHFSQALGTLYALRVIRPTLAAFTANRLPLYHERFVIAESDPALNEFVTAVRDADATQAFKTYAIREVVAALTLQGIPFADLTPESFLYHSMTMRDFAQRSRSHAVKYNGHLAWQIMHQIGHFSPGSPPTLRAALRAPQLTTTEMVDRYTITEPQIRQLFIDYFDRRSVTVKYSTLQALSTYLVGNFWSVIMQINPDQHDLHLSEDTYQRWRSHHTLCNDGTTRTDPWATVIAVQSFYYDICAWAVNEPERWAYWAAPCPVPRSEVRQLAKHKRRRQERTYDTIRSLQPLLPALVDYIDRRNEHWGTVLKTATTTADGKSFTVDEHTYTRVITRGDREQIAAGAPAGVHVRSARFGRAVDAAFYEDSAFWMWAIVETLRHSGLRIEELTELSQLSVRQYRRPNDEVVALLVVAPSKSDRERVIPMSTELFHVIACILRRITRVDGSVPLATRYDDNDRTTSDPQPFLFQRRIGQRREVMTTGAIGTSLRQLCIELSGTDSRFTGLHFRPHDFRRLFATDLVNNGLPIHIGAALLGHLDLETTRGYVAVFEEDTTRHYQAHLQRRRAVRPSEEYRSVTAQEWTDFEEHFDKRKVELGSCGRPYATPCSHEHACIRCPMLHVDPRMITRLTDIETDLDQRRRYAGERGWLGEIEGIDLTLECLRTKLDDARRLAQRTTALGIPTVPAAR